MKPKVNNHPDAIAGKVALRRWLLEQLADPEVLDCYSGDQEMRRLAYEGIPWRGIDKVQGGPGQYVGDNLRVVRALDLTRWNLFDVDAYGEPWALLRIIAKRRPLTGRVGVVLTASGRNTMAAKMSATCEAATGCAWWPPKGEAATLLVDIMESWIVELWGGQIQERRRVLRPGGTWMLYDALVVEPRATPASAACSADPGGTRR